MKNQETQLQQGPARSSAPPEQAPPPWRTEGLPKGAPAKQRPRWVVWAQWLLIYGALFALLTMQDRLSGPQVVAYTEFKAQVASKNVHEVFARGNTVQGVLKQPRPVPGQPTGTYQKFTTERPTFAVDDLLSQLEANAATVRAKPLVEERGFFANLLISVAPLVLIFGLYGLWFKRQQKSMGGLGGLFGSRASKPVDREKVRATFDDVAGIDEVKAEISEVVDFLKEPESIAGWGPACPRACC